MLVDLTPHIKRTLRLNRGMNPSFERDSSFFCQQSHDRFEIGEWNVGFPFPRPNEDHIDHGPRHLTAVDFRYDLVDKGLLFGKCDPEPIGELVSQFYGVVREHPLGLIDIQWVLGESCVRG